MKFGFLLLFFALGCKKPSESVETKPLPKPEPTATPAPAKGTIALQNHGKGHRLLDGTQLSTMKPDYEDEEHRAFKLERFFPDAGADEYSVTGEKGVRVVLPVPHKPEDPIPVLAINRKGDVVASMLSGSAPFPEYHGKGGRLSRPGDPLPHLVGVTRVNAVAQGEVHDKPPEPRDAGGEEMDAAAAEHKIEVRLGGATLATWTLESLADTHKIQERGAAKGARDTWSLRELVSGKAPKNARVTGLFGRGGRKLPLSQKDWNDSAKIPVLRINRRGEFKFQWMRGDGGAADGDELRDVRGIELSP